VTDLQISQPVSAQITLWRVFGLIDKFEDQPSPYWSTHAPGLRPDTDQLTVLVGEVPDGLLSAVSQWRAQANIMLNLLVGRSMTYEERIDAYKTALETIHITEFNEPYTAWLTLRLTRSLKVMSSPVELGWLIDTESVMQAMESFADEGSQFLDIATARVMGATKGLNVRRLRFAGRQPFLTAEGKAAMSIPRFETKIKDSGIIVGRSGGWASAPTERITSVISSLPSIRTSYKLVGQPASWLCSAMAEEDDLLRFTFAYGGLELLATQTEKANRGTLIAKIESLDSKMPISQLLWPTTNKDYVSRNIVFRFAAMATLYSPETAVEDVRKFKEIADARNNFYHGSERTINGAIASNCEELLFQYVGRVSCGVPGAK
jgi:hypothetical protein